MVSSENGKRQDLWLFEDILCVDQRTGFHIFFLLCVGYACEDTVDNSDDILVRWHNK